MPEFRSGIDVTRSLAWGVRGSTRFDFTGRQYCLNTGTGALDRLNGSTRADLGVDRDFALGRSVSGVWSKVRASLGMANVADAGIYDQCGLPQPGRTVRFGLTLS